MSTKLRGLLIAFAALSLGSTTFGQLVNVGPNGEYFFDSSTGLYWYDPSQWVGQSRATIDAFVVASPIWAWATSAQINALNGKSAPTGQSLVSVMGPQQFTLSNGGPRWIGYYSSTVAPDGWLVQSFGSAGFTTIDATGFQNNVSTWGPGAWLVATSAPVATLSIGQPQGSGSVLIQVAGPPAAGFAGAVYITAISFHPANATAPNLGWWYGLHIALPDLITEIQTGLPPFFGTLDANGQALFGLPPGSLSPSIPLVYAVTTCFDTTLSTVLGFTPIVSIDIM